MKWKIICDFEHNPYNSYWPITRKICIKHKRKVTETEIQFLKEDLPAQILWFNIELYVFHPITPLFYVWNFKKSKLLPLHIFLLYTPNELNHALILRCCMHVWWNLFKTPQMVWARVLLQEPMHDQMPWHRIPGPIQQAGNCLHKSWLKRITANVWKKI